MKISKNRKNLGIFFIYFIYSLFISHLDVYTSRVKINSSFISHSDVYICGMKISRNEKKTLNLFFFKLTFQR